MKCVFSSSWFPLLARHVLSQQQQKCKRAGRTAPALFKVSPCIASVNIQLAKASHVAKGQQLGKGETIVVVLKITYYRSYWDNKGDS